MRKYKNILQTVVSDQNVESGCNELSFMNTGSDNVSISGFILEPGFTLAFSGNGDEKDVTIYNLAFETTTNPRVDVWKKYYVNSLGD